MKTVLHITEAFGAGIQTAIDSYVQSTQDSAIKHLLLARRRPQDDIGLKVNAQFHHVEMVEGNLLHFYLKAKQIIKIHNPDVIHLHSSFAGFLGRFLPKQHRQIIYTPHCYGFERCDISPLKRKIYHTLERFRLSSIDVVAGCSLRECALAKNLGAKQSLYLPNYANIQDALKIGKMPLIKQQFNVVIVGRISAQKDPEFLIQTMAHLSQYPESTQLKLHWIGGGDKNWTDTLEKCGVSVSGIVQHKEVIKALKNADLYLHTAAWEGMPLTLLEAAKLNVPMILRNIGATEDLPCPFLVRDPFEMAKEIIAFIKNPTDPRHQSALTLINQEFSLEKQKIALLRLYGFDATPDFSLNVKTINDKQNKDIQKEGAA